jgi:hypothetical protein
MRCICVECGFLYNLKEPIEDDETTHGYCDECFAIYINNLETKKGGGINA